MDKGIITKITDAAKIFQLGLEDIEKEVVFKLKDVERLIELYNKYILDLKLQEKANDKKLEDVKARLADELKKQNDVTRSMEAELAKHSKLTSDMQANKARGDEALKILHITKEEAFKDLENRKKLTEQIKIKLMEIEKREDAVIKKTKENEVEYQKLLNKEAELNGIRSKIEKEKIDLIDKQTDYALRVKNIERVEKQLKLRE